MFKRHLQRNEAEVDHVDVSSTTTDISSTTKETSLNGGAFKMKIFCK